MKLNRNRRWLVMFFLLGGLWLVTIKVSQSATTFASYKDFFAKTMEQVMPLMGRSTTAFAALEPGKRTTSAVVPGNQNEDATAVLFLIDKSQSVDTLCLDKSINNSRALIPRFFYTLLLNYPHNRDNDLYLGMGTFPKASGALAYSVEPVSALKGRNWFTEIETIANDPTQMGLQFMDAVTAGITALNAVPMASKHLIVIGDGLMVFEGTSDWDRILGRTQQSSLTRLLETNTVKLTYVLMNCAPDSTGASEDDYNSYYANFGKWREVLKENAQAGGTWIRVLGLQELLDPSTVLTPEEAIEALFDGEIFSPFFAAGKDREGGWGILSAGRNSHTETMAIPGYAESVILSAVTTDVAPQIDTSHRPIARPDEFMEFFDPNRPLLHHYQLTLNPQSVNPGCSGWDLALTTNNGTPSFAVYWWSVEANAGRIHWEVPVEGDDPLANDPIANDAKKAIQIRGTTTLSGSLIRQSESQEALPPGFHPCYQFRAYWMDEEGNIRGDPAGQVMEEAVAKVILLQDEQYPLEMVYHPMPYEPRPLRLVIQLLRTVNVREGTVAVQDADVHLRSGTMRPTSGEIVVYEGDAEIRAGEITTRDGLLESVTDGAMIIQGGSGYITYTEQITVTDVAVTFVFEPVLDEGAETFSGCQAGDQGDCQLTAQIRYATADYYEEDALAEATFYLLSLETPAQLAQQGCDIPFREADEGVFIENQGESNETTWYHTDPHDGLVGHYVEFSVPGDTGDLPQFSVEMPNDERIECSIQRLVIRWASGEARHTTETGMIAAGWQPVVCDFNSRECTRANLIYHEPSR